MDFKNTLRKEIEHNLKALSTNTIKENSKLIYNNIIKLDIWTRSTEVFIYKNFRKEVETQRIINKAINCGKTVHAPLINNKDISFYRIDNIAESEMVRNKLGILEPATNIPKSIPTSKTIIIIPGVAFSKNRDRLGRGGGFYDRYLSNNPDIIKIAIAFDLQIYNEIPTESWDIKMDYIVTDKQVYTEGELI